MPDVADLLEETAHTTVTYKPGFDVHIVYRPERYEHGMSARLSKMSKTNDIDVLSDVLLNLLVEWDVTDKGIPVPLTKEALSKRSNMFLSAILVGIRTDIDSPKNASSSETGSSPAAKGGFGRATTRSSEPPGTSE